MTSDTSRSSTMSRPMVRTQIGGLIRENFLEVCDQVILRESNSEPLPKATNSRCDEVPDRGYQHADIMMVDCRSSARASHKPECSACGTFSFQACEVCQEFFHPGLVHIRYLSSHNLRNQDCLMVSWCGEIIIRETSNASLKPEEACQVPRDRDPAIQAPC
jgi:hypothetical protein